MGLDTLALSSLIIFMGSSTAIISITIIISIMCVIVIVIISIIVRPWGLTLCSQA